MNYLIYIIILNEVNNLNKFVNYIVLLNGTIKLKARVSPWGPT